MFRWDSSEPKRLLQLIKFLEASCTIVQLTLEFGSGFVDSGHGTIWIGLFSPFIFVPFIISVHKSGIDQSSIIFSFKKWTSFLLACNPCGNKTLNVYLLIMSSKSLFIDFLSMIILTGIVWAILLVIGTIFSLLTIGFESYFLTNPCTCFLEPKLCCAVGSLFEVINGDFKNISTICSTLVSENGSTSSEILCRNKPIDKIPYIKGQLFIGIVMLIGCISGMIYSIYRFCQSNRIQLSSIDHPALDQANAQPAEPETPMNQVENPIPQIVVQSAEDSNEIETTDDVAFQNLNKPFSSSTTTDS